MAETELTKKYRTNFPWFKWHLHLQDVPDFQFVYIHSGGDHTHTEGCILVSDSFAIGDKDVYLNRSRKAFERLYKFLGEELDNGVKVRIIVKDEKWINQTA